MFILEKSFTKKKRKITSNSMVNIFKFVTRSVIPRLQYLLPTTNCDYISLLA